ncbi:helix-turn-helix transcriptional regulator [Umezawaea sp. Da 62-37]|uniref:helix-turn-helix domain-containing protein n=1 Tax=Umezawaea sp. Da 62-37 TaxID=3075927 RepID=UPI0028F74DFD|nr:helix-turn-helix transcriptional regulator [Umezawaea sp. Da 62-37]WNV90529.1 helix-turn-helix transcriptional regulator [Umezawaea sp. Da 62-37]
MAEDFGNALTRAIEASGLSLERIQHHLARRGAQVSLSTLSYWRRGRSRPERPESLRVVKLLEEILAVDDLLGSLGPKRPRGRWTEQTAERELTLEGIWDVQADGLNELMLKVDHLEPTPVTYLTWRDVMTVGADGRELEFRSSGVLRADEDGLDRFLAIQRADAEDESVGRISAQGACRIGRVRTEQEHGFLIAEVLFDRMLRAGDTALVDYRIASDPGAVSSVTDRRFLRGARDYVLQVNFHPDAVPVRCYRFRQETSQHPATDVRDLWIGTTHSVHLVAHDTGPGILGIRWEWE